MAITVINLSDAVSTWVTKTNTIATQVGDLALLSTGDSDLVKGINTVDSEIGTLSLLTTNDKSNLVNAINEAASFNDSAQIKGLFRDYVDSNQSINFDSANGTFNLDSDSLTSYVFKDTVTLNIIDSAGTIIKTLRTPGE